MKDYYDRETENECRTDEIIQRYGKNPERICQAARVRGINTDSWYIAASELAKIDMGKKGVCNE